MPPNDPWPALLASTHDPDLWISGYFNASKRRQYWQSRYEALAALVEGVVRAAMEEQRIRKIMVEMEAGQERSSVGGEWVTWQERRMAAVDALLARVAVGEGGKDG